MSFRLWSLESKVGEDSLMIKGKDKNNEDKEKTVVLKDSEWEAWFKFMVKQPVYPNLQGRKLLSIMEKVGKQLSD